MSAPDPAEPPVATTAPGLGPAARVAAEAADTGAEPRAAGGRARAARARAAAVLDALAAEPWRFDFFQAMRRLECAHPDHPRWGESLHLFEDPARLGQEPSLAFAPSTLASFDRGAGVAREGTPGAAAAEAPEEALPARLQVLFFGLFGPNGPLPLHLTDYARDRMRNAGDPTLARFADLFHHRLLALFYRAWASGEPAAHHDRPDQDRFAAWVGALFGMGSRALHPGHGLPATALLHHAASMAAPSRHAEGLAGMLSDYVGVPARVESFVGHWIELPAGAPCRLGGPESCAALGRTATVGSRVWDCQHKFRVVLGPMEFADYTRLLPGGDTLGRLQTMVRVYVGDELGWDLNLILKKQAIPPLELGRHGLLGWTSWLHGKPAARDADELVLDPLVHAA